MLIWYEIHFMLVLSLMSFKYYNVKNFSNELWSHVITFQVFQLSCWITTLVSIKTYLIDWKHTIMREFLNNSRGYYIIFQIIAGPKMGGKVWICCQLKHIYLIDWIWKHKYSWIIAAITILLFQITKYCLESKP